MKQRNNVFSHIGALSPGRSVFDLSYQKIFTGELGELYPVMCDEMVPGDTFQIGNEAVLRFMPLVAPILHTIKLYVHYFFVPYRLLWNAETNEELEETGNWEDYITGGVDGTNSDTLPIWVPTDTTVGSLWDYLGFPTGIDPQGLYPMDFPRRAYNLVYNEYYRDETLITAIGLDNEDIQKRAWAKDYFTSALPWQQRGTAPSLPISGTTSAVWTTANVSTASGTLGVGFTTATGSDPTFYGTSANGQANILGALNANTVDLSSATTFDVADLRLAFQIQKWLERNARAGARYKEFLLSHFGYSVKDSRLMRPEYIGGNVSPIIVSEVQQNSETNTTPQGTLAGNGISVQQGVIGRFTAPEFGLMMGILSVMPDPMYLQGINRQWIKTSKYDFYFPEFANLSEQEIYNGEICAKDADSTHNAGTFGYQGRYDEMRYKPNMVCGEMRTTFDYWHLGRIFNPASPPTLNQDFIECDPDKRIFASESDPAFVINYANLIKAIRPIPIQSEPGLIDHN